MASPTLLSSALRYYRLVARWLVQCANPTGAELPLPAEVPKIFSALPEYVITTNRTLPLALALALPLPLALARAPPPTRHAAQRECQALRRGWHRRILHRLGLGLGLGLGVGIGVGVGLGLE